MGNTLFVMTNKEAPKNKLFALNTEDKNQTRKEILAEADDVLDGVDINGGKIIANYMHNAASQAFVFNLYGELIHEVKFPGLGSVSGFTGDNESNLTFYSFTSFTSPNVAYQYNIETNESIIYRKSEIDFDFEGYETKQIFYSSTDGTQIPMFITHKKGLELTADISSGIPDTLTVDAGHLRQIVVNLIGNAIKFTERGEVNLTVTNESETDTEIRFSKDSELLKHFLNVKAIMIED